MTDSYDIILRICSYLDVTDLFVTVILSKSWNRAAEQAFSYLLEDNTYNYLAYKRPTQYSAAKSLCRHVWNRRNDRSGGFLLLGGSFGSYRRESVWIRDSSVYLEAELLQSFARYPQMGCSAQVMNQSSDLVTFGGWIDDEANPTAIDLAFRSREHLQQNSNGSITEDQAYLSQESVDIAAEMEFFPRLTQPRCFAAATTTINGTYIVLGGGASPFRGAETYSDCLVSEGIDCAWRNDVISPMTVPRCGHSAVTLFNDQILTIGGYGGSIDYHNSAELWDWHQMRWIPQPAMTYRRSGMAAAIGPGGAIYVTGGSNNGRDGNHSLERFDPREGRWTELAGMFQGRGYCSGAIGASGLFYVCGGLDSARFQGGLECYDARADRWMIVPGSCHTNDMDALAIAMFPPGLGVENEALAQQLIGAADAIALGENINVLALVQEIAAVNNNFAEEGQQHVSAVKAEHFLRAAHQLVYVL